MPTIYIMRHAHALSVQEDPSRSLSEQGIENARKIGNFFKKNAIVINSIFHSSVARAKQTAEIVADEVGLQHTLTYFPFLDPDMDVTQLSNMIGQMGDKVLLVGHLPNLELLSNYLLTYDYQHSTLSYMPAGVAAFTIQENRCMLEWFVNPLLVS